MSVGLILSLVLASAAAVAPYAHAQQTVTVQPYMVELLTNSKTIVPGKPASVEVLVMDASSKVPRPGLNVKASVTMPAMAGMVVEQPSVTRGDEPGRYRVWVTFPQVGTYKLEMHVNRRGQAATIVSLRITRGSSGKAVEYGTSKSGSMPGMPGMQGKQAMPGMQGKQPTPGVQGKQPMPGMQGKQPMPGMQGKQPMPGMPGIVGMQMKAIFGTWSVNREGSGTSWQPDSSPMFMKMLPSLGGFEFGMMGTLQAGYVDAGGKRGDKGLFSNSMIMFMGRKDLAGGTLGLHFMTSLDPILNGARGVPNLFQNSFKVHGVSVGDRKDPHNIFAELAVSYSHPISRDWSGFLYGGPVGEPALGNVMYFHRMSGLEIPEAPISHDWFDGSHISFGVGTLGLAYQNKWKLEGSVFNSDEPGKNLYGIGPIALNSASGRLSYNPSRDWSFSASYGYLHADVNEHRFTFSGAYSHDLPHGDNLSVTAYFGQNIVQGSTNSNAWLAEGTYYHSKDAFFARFERVDKPDLVDVPIGNYTINKLVFGDVHNFYTRGQIDYGLGAYVGVYSFPGSLNDSYGKNPITFGVFLRIRPSKQ